MKKISKLVAITMLLGTLSPAGYAQNLNKHIDNADNMSIDYLKPSDEYVLGGITHPGTVGGMSNTGAFGGNLERIQLEKLDKQLNNVWFKTYTTADEVNVVKDGQCSALSNYFTLGDAKQTKDEGFIICGRVRRDPETSGCGVLGNYDHMFLLKTDKDGKVQWFKRYDHYGMLTSVVEAPNGDFIACGYLGSDGLANGLIIYTDPGGKLSWSKEAQTPAYWDHSAIILSQYYEVINFKGNFAVVGIANTMGTIWGGTLITVVDGSGNYLQNSIIDNEPYGYVMTGRAVADAQDGDIVITGTGGSPCNMGGHIFILKIEPVSMTVNFLRMYSYNKGGEASWGSSIDVEPGKRIFATGRDAVTNGGGGLYIETDYAGNLNRYSVFNNSEGSWGKGIVCNTSNGIPTFSGQYFPGAEPTFVVKDDQNKDCSPDIPVPDYSTPYDIYPSYDRDPGVKHIDDYAYDYDLKPSEKIVCGSQAVTAAKSGTTGIANITAGELSLSPNPATDHIKINISNTNFAAGTLKVYDITGRILITRDVKEAGNIHISTALLQPGMYILSVERQNGATLKSNFIKN